MTIKELERRTGLPRTSIRFYEQEGLLTPERRENNYRDYSEDNVRTLEKIKLLRRLSLDLDAIRRLQAGELSLSRALAGQALALEGDRADLERYAQVCEELSRTETSYDDLDPEPWLAALEEKSLPLSRRVDPAEQDAIAAAPYPWRRFFARMLDLFLTIAVWKAIQFFALHIHGPQLGLEELLYYTATNWGGWLVLLAVEPILLAVWGYTPGKWLLGLRVRREDGRKLAWDDAMERTAKVFLYGFGLGIPFVDLWRLGESQSQCKKDQVMPWDRGLWYTVRPLRLRRGLGMVLCLLLAVGLNWGVEDASWRIPHPEGPLTPEQVVENYNFLVERADDRLPLNHALPQLAPDGAWETAPPADLDGEWVDIRNAWESEWSPLSFMVDEQGFATGFTVTWSPQASPYTGRLRLDDAMLEYLPDLLLALSPSGEGWHFPWQSEWFQRRWLDGGGVQSAFSRSGMDYTQPGARASWDGVPGVSVTLEVVESRGYRALDIDSDSLTQSEGQTGKLVLQFTVWAEQGEEEAA